MEILYHANRVYLLFAFSSNQNVVLIGRINTQRNEARRLEEEVSNVEDRPHDEQVTPLEENTNVDQAPTIPPPMM